MTDNDNRTEALGWAETSNDPSTMAITHALLYVGDALSDVVLELGKGETREAAPKLTALLNQATPFVETDHEPVATEDKPGPVIMRNGREYTPAYDPRLWKMDGVTGEWISPKGRRFGPQTRQVLGVIRRIEEMRRAGTLYTKPIEYPEPQQG